MRSVASTQALPKLAVTALTVGLRVLLIIIVAVLVRFLIIRAVNQLVSRVATETRSTRVLRGRAREALLEVSPSLVERRQQRAETIGSLLRSVTTLFVFTVAVITILGQLGVNLAPIVAGAGIVGIAIGFGAQNLVKDFLTGMFMLLEDQYGVGDVVDAGPASGTVEAVGLRTTRLRDVNGVVWHIRNGTISRIGNSSQGWSRALIDVLVAQDADVPTVRAVLKQVADSVWHDDDFGPVVLSEPEVWGVEALTVDGVVVRLVVQTAPLEQWRVARELRERIKAAFDQAGIELPRLSRSVWLHTDDRRAPVVAGESSEGDWRSPR